MKHREGQSLMEVMVGLVLMSVAALAISSTLGVVSGQKMRTSSGSLDLQAAGYAKQVLEELRNSVGTNTTSEIQARLVDSTGTGTTYQYVLADPTTHWIKIPDGDLLNHSGTRTYTVWDVFDGGKLAYKKVTVSVTWNDPS